MLFTTPHFFYTLPTGDSRPHKACPHCDRRWDGCQSVKFWASFPTVHRTVHLSILCITTLCKVAFRLLLTSVSLVIFCLLFSFVDYVPVKGEIIWYLSLTAWLISLSIMFSSSIHAVAKGISAHLLSSYPPDLKAPVVITTANTQPTYSASPVLPCRNHNESSCPHFHLLLLPADWPWGLPVWHTPYTAHLLFLRSV